MPAELAEETLARLRADLPKLKARLKAEFENSAEWKAAVEAVKKAAKDYEAARRTALSRVRAKPEYVKAASEHEKARQEFDALADRDADEKTAESLLRRVLTARAAKDKLESAGLKADPAVDAARAAPAGSVSANTSRQPPQPQLRAIPPQNSSLMVPSCAAVPSALLKYNSPEMLTVPAHLGRRRTGVRS